jgi:mono/diheme cytochrome c family protein
MDRYTFCFLIFCGWFVIFRMFPAKDSDWPMNKGLGVCPVNEEWENRISSSAHSVGKQAFTIHCLGCHDLGQSGKIVENGLYGVSQRIPSGDWIYDWIHDSQKMIRSGDAYAVMVWNANDQVEMPSFPQLSNETIDDIMAYINSCNITQY